MTPEERARQFFGDYPTSLLLAEEFRAAIAEEREACAKLADVYAFGTGTREELAARDIAIAIRAQT